MAALFAGMQRAEGMAVEDTDMLTCFADVAKLQIHVLIDTPGRIIEGQRGPRSGLVGLSWGRTGDSGELPPDQTVARIAR